MKNLTRKVREAICALLAAVMVLTNTGMTVLAQESAQTEETWQELDAAEALTDEVPLEEGATEEKDTAEENTDDEVMEGTSEEDASTEETVSENEQAEETADVEETEISESGLELALSNKDIASGEYKEDGNDITWVIDADGKLTVEGKGDFAASDKNNHSDDRAPWYESREYIKTAEINVTGMKDASYMFCDCYSLTDLDLSKFDTSSVTDMRWMFAGCVSLASLDLSKFNTSNVTDMSWMFEGCGLKSLDLSKFNTSSVTNMVHMFEYCDNLTSLDLRSFDTRNVTDMGGMFEFCNNLTSLNLSSFDTSSVLNMSCMFWNCNSLTNLDLSRFDTSRVTFMEEMFWDCSSLKSLDLSKFDTSRVTDMEEMFRGCSSLKSLDLSKFNTSRMNDMTYMFEGCNSLTNLDLSSFDTSRVIDMSHVFEGCSSLRDLDLSGFNMGSVTDMENMFEGCSSLSSIYTPRNLKLSVTFPSSDKDDYEWYDMSGEVYTELPTGLSYSLLLEQGAKPTVSEERIKATKVKTSYYVGDTVNTDDLTVRHYTSDGTVKILDAKDYQTNVKEIDTSKAGSQILTITYKTSNSELTAEIELTISEKKEEGGDVKEKLITATKAKTSYYVGDTINIDDLTVTCYSSDGSEKVLDAKDYQTNAKEIDTSKAGSQILTITYQTSDGELTTVIKLTISKNEEGGSTGDLIFSDTDIAHDEYKEEGCDIRWVIDEKGNLSAEGIWNDDYYDPDIYNNPISGLWSSYSEEIITVNNIKVTGVKDASGMFEGCPNLTSVDLSNFDTSKVTDMSEMFSYCENLTSVDLSGFDTKNVTNMREMFGWCNSLISVDVSGFNTSNVTNMGSMFSGCNSLISVDVRGFNTSNVTYMSYMFSDCESLTSLDVSSFNTSKATDMDGMFTCCSSLTSLDLSSFDMGSVASLVGSEMFDACWNLSSIYTPRNLNIKDIQLPIDEYDNWVWYDMSGDIYSDLPTGLSYSVLLERGAKPAVSKECIKATKEKTFYYVGDTVDTDDLTVKYYGSDGTVKILEAADYTVSKADTQTAGTKTLTITYKTLTTEIALTVSKKEGSGDTNEERITATKVKTSYYVGDTVNTDDLTVTYYGSDGSKEILEASDYQTNAAQINTSEAGNRTLTITYQTSEGELKAEIELTISKKTEEGGNTKEERITATKAKTSYYVGETVNTDDLTVTYYGSDGSKEILKAADYQTNAAQINTSEAGVQTLTITYQTPEGELKAEIELTISKKAEEGGDAGDKDDSAYEDSERADLKSIGTIANIKAKVYDGSAYEPAVKVTVTVDGKRTTLTEGADYRVLYSNNVNAGTTGKVIVRGNGTYKGEITQNLTISQKPIKKLKVIAGSIAQNTTVSNLSSLPICVYDGTRLLQYGTDYTLSDYGTVRSTASVTVTGAGNYKDSVTAKLTIYDADADHTINSGNVRLNASSFAYTGKAVKPEVTVTVNGITNRDYKVQYQNNKNAGTAYVVVTGKGAYKGKAVVPFTINAENVAANAITIKDIPAKTYNGKLQKPSVTVSIQKDGKTKKLAKNKDYTVSYKDNFHAGDATITITGKGNYAGLSATKKFKINPQKISKASLKGTQNNLMLTYSKKKLKEGTDYEKPIYGEVIKNKVQVTIKGKGDFTDEMKKNVKISQ